MNQIDMFKHQITVLDTETTNINPAEAEIVEIAGQTWIDNQLCCLGSFLLGSRHGIPPAASAKNNISNRMITDLPYFDQQVQTVKKALNWPHSTYYVAHNAQYDREVLSVEWNRIGNTEDCRICEDNNRWICTFRLSKALLDEDFEDMEYNLNYLRYRLDLNIPDGEAHRAEHDTLMCAKLLEILIDYGVATGRIDNTKDIGKQLVELSWSPLKIRKFPFGKHRGVAIADVPTDYYQWAINKLDSFQENNERYDRDLVETVRAELERRLTT